MLIELGIGGIGIVVIGMFLAIEHRLTRLETKMEMICDGLSKNN